MSTIPTNIRKSDFVETEQSESTDYLDLVRNGQNLKIKQSNLVADFGVTGSLETLGEVTGTPVLQKVDTVNFIRNILGGPGIINEVSPGNGVRISHNFTADKGGVPVLYNEGGDSPIIRSLIAGAGISIGASGGEIQVSATGTPASTKTVIVYTIDDFPTASGGIITLADNTEYYLVNDIATSNRFIFGENTVLSGADGTLITLQYTGSSTMLTAADKNVKIKDIFLSCPSGTLFAVSSSTGLHLFRMYVCNVICDNIGNFHNMRTVYMYNVNFSLVSTQGFTFTGNFNIGLFEVIGGYMPSGTGNFADLGTATFDSFTFTRSFININTTGYALTGATNSANINADGIGVVTNNRQFGTATPINNISPFDDRWAFALNPSVPDSHDMCLATHGGATITIGAAATPVIIGATWNDEITHRFTSTIGGRFTYTGKGSHVDVTATITADIATGIDDVSFFLYKNSVQITNSRVTREFDSGDPGNLSLVWAIDLDTTDYLELWVQNDDAAVNVIIINITLRIGN